MSDKSLSALLQFLEWTAEKGLMAKNTVGGRKAAVTAVLGILDPEEKGDVTAVDLDSAMTRFVNLQGKKYNTSSLNVYKSRTNAAINDFRKWIDDPLTFKPQTNKSEKKAVNKPGRSGASKESRQDPQTFNATPATHQATANVFPVPIRENVVVRIHGLPFDLSKAEAEKIANVVRAMAMSD